jgi:hypothetical protein
MLECVASREIGSWITIVAVVAVWRLVWHERESPVIAASVTDRDRHPSHRTRTRGTLRIRLNRFHLIRGRGRDRQRARLTVSVLSSSSNRY